MGNTQFRKAKKEDKELITAMRLPEIGKTQVREATKEDKELVTETQKLKGWKGVREIRIK